MVDLGGGSVADGAGQRQRVQAVEGATGGNHDHAASHRDQPGQQHRCPFDHDGGGPPSAGNSNCGSVFTAGAGSGGGSAIAAGPGTGAPGNRAGDGAVGK